MALSNLELAEKLNTVADGWLDFIAQARALLTTPVDGGPNSDGHVVISDGVINENVPGWKLLSQLMQKGDQGERGAGILAGHGAPSNALGNNDDVYLDLDSGDFFGPKAGGVWGSSIVATGMQALLTQSIAARDAAQAAQVAAQGIADGIADVADQAAQVASQAAQVAADRDVVEAAQLDVSGKLTQVNAAASSADADAAAAEASRLAALAAQAAAEAARDEAEAVLGFDPNIFATKTYAKRAAKKAALLFGS